MFQAEEVNFPLVLFSSTITLLVLVIMVFLFLHKYRQKQFENIEAQRALRLQFEHDMLRTRIEIQEQAFSNISREIHDNVGQLLTLARIQLNLIEQDPSSGTHKISEVKETVGRALKDLRDIAGSLSGEQMMAGGLLNAVQTETARINRLGILTVELAVNGNPQQLSPDTELVLFRIIQEALQNTIKHAAASGSVINLHYQSESLTLTIGDNGKGFDHDSLPGHGMGLKNIRSRILALRGSVTMHSEPGNGTTITLTIPYEQHP